MQKFITKLACLACPALYLLAARAQSQTALEGLPRDSPAGLGAGGPRFKSGRSDQFISFVYRNLAAGFAVTSPQDFSQAGGRILQPIQFP
jgi:hypothetical protein